MLALRVYVFLGAFLLFSMEPLVGRLLLPEFGGAFCPALGGRGDNRGQNPFSAEAAS